jgi:DNA-binding transcriptional LysR family regulator
MELRHLRQFVVVAEEGHITRAAERLGMHQPPLSQRIKAIETELDVQLFRRKARGVELTEAGRVFLDRVRATIAQYDGTLEATRSAARGEQGRLCVGVMPTAPFHPFVPFVIRAFRAAFPLVSLTLDECLRKEALERLHDGKMDVAFMRAHLDEPHNLLVNPLLVEPMVVALPGDHPMARRDRGGAVPISLKDLAGENIHHLRAAAWTGVLRSNDGGVPQGRVQPSSWPGSATHYIRPEPWVPPVEGLRSTQGRP